MTQPEGGPAAPIDVVSVLWATPATGRRGPKPRHSLDAIVDAAMAIADDEGLDAVTMQRVADRLGTAKMALYRYVPGRAELDAVLLDRGLGVPPEITDGDWRAALAAWASAVYVRMRARPWSVELAQRRHIPGPGELAWYERGLEAVDGLALSGAEKLDLLALLVGHAASIVRQETASPAPEDDLAAGLAPILADHAAEYPRTAAAFADAARETQRNAALTFGVERVLAGVAALVADRD
jgi:AcrR family transcriptional regulator